MKRSEMIHLGANVLDNKLDSMDNYELVDAILSEFENAGIKAPGIVVESKYPNRNWGIGCTMRCDCEWCNPRFTIHEWEFEDEN